MWYMIIEVGEFKGSFSHTNDGYKMVKRAYDSIIRKILYTRSHKGN